MATKKASVKRGTAAKRTARKKKTARSAARSVKKAVRKPSTNRTRKAAKKKAVKKKRPAAGGRKKKAPARRTAKTTRRRKSLGRPRIPGDARLDLVSQKDYQAREVFGFLGVATVRELEQFGPDEIIQKLTSPMVQTVGRIRKALAVANRSLSGDKRFALEFRDQYMSRK